MSSLPVGVIGVWSRGRKTLAPAQKQENPKTKWIIQKQMNNTRICVQKSLNICDFLSQVQSGPISKILV
jgi:hypothetical protein